MAAQPNVVELQNAHALRLAEEERVRNRVLLTKLLRSVYFLAKNDIPHTTSYSDLVDLQIANGDQILEQHVTRGPSNASSIPLHTHVDHFLQQLTSGLIKDS